MSTNAPLGESGMSDLAPRDQPAEQDVPMLRPSDDGEAPARRLLAHDLEHLVWDEDGEGPAPPPD